MTPDNLRGSAACQEALPPEEAKLLVARFKELYGEILTNWAFNFVGGSLDQPQAVISTHHHPKADRLNFIISGPIGDLELESYNGIRTCKDLPPNYWGLSSHFRSRKTENRPFSLSWFSGKERDTGLTTLMFSGKNFRYEITPEGKKFSVPDEIKGPSHAVWQIEGDNLHILLEPPLVNRPWEITFPWNITYKGKFFANRQNLI